MAVEPITLFTFINEWLDEVLKQPTVYIVETPDNKVIVHYPVDKMKSRYIFVKEKDINKNEIEGYQLQLKILMMLKKYNDEKYEKIDLENVITNEDGKQFATFVVFSKPI
jgi:hypothetical protein